MGASTSKTPEAAKTTWLLQLPFELLDEIVGLVDDPKTLYILCLVSHQLRHVAHPKLFRNVSIASAYQADRFRLALLYKPEYKERIESMEVSSMNNRFQNGVEIPLWQVHSTFPILETYHNLRRLSLVTTTVYDSSRPVDHWKDELRSIKRLLFPADQPIPRATHVWPNLTSLALTFRPVKFVYPSHKALAVIEFWPSLFSSPTLREVTLGGCYFVGPQAAQRDRLGLEYAHQTPLQTLRLCDCQITADSARIALSAPRSLKRFILQNSDPREPLHLSDVVRFTEDVEEWNEAIIQQRHSLEHLEIGLTRISPRDERLLDFRVMEKLRTVSMPPENTVSQDTSLQLLIQPSVKIIPQRIELHST